MEQNVFGIVALFTCRNRREKTINCINSLVQGNPKCHFTFVVVDDGSTDGTKEALLELKKELDIYLLEADGTAYYSGGMRKGMLYILEYVSRQYDYLFMLNDDVAFYDESVQKMVDQSREMHQAVIVGATCGDDGQLSYSAIQYTSGIKYRQIPTDDFEIEADTFNANAVLIHKVLVWNQNSIEIEADTFNANAVLIPYKDFMNVGAMDQHYIHSLGDFDYGLSLKKSGCRMYVSKMYVGVCNTNSSKGTWTDTDLSRMERLKRKESVKGAPLQQWYYFLKKNFGITRAIVSSITPYIRILIKK